MRNQPQPDGLMMVMDGGRATIRDRYVAGGPELVGEVAASSLSIDRGEKFQAYQRNSVLEYVLWRVEDREVDWFALRSVGYVPLLPGADGILRSEVFPGLWLDPAALAALDAQRVHAVLQEGIAAPEHAAFVARLRSRSGNA